MCIYCKSVVHNDHVARWASHFRACLQIPAEDRSEYDSYAGTDVSLTSTTAGNSKKRKFGIEHGQGESSSNDPMDLLLAAVAGTGTDNLSTNSTSTIVKGGKERTKSSNGKSSSSRSSSSTSSTSEEAVLFSTCNKAFRQGLESGMLLFDKFTKLMVEKLASKESVDANSPENLSSIKEELSNDFKVFIAKNMENIEIYDADSVIDELVSRTFKQN